MASVRSSVRSGFIWASLALSLAAAATVRAQETPADTAQVLERIARDLRDSGRTELTEALLELIAERYPGTESARFADSILDAIRAPRTARAGRNHMIAWNTIYGVWLGVALPLTFDEDPDESALGLGLLILPPTAFLIAKRFSDNSQVTRAQAAGQTFGSLWGTFQGFGWKEVLDIGRSQDCFVDLFPGQTFCFDDDSETAGFAMGVVGGVAGLALGHVLARNLEPGTMTAVGHGATWGTWFGAALGILADQEDDALLTWSLMGGNIALVATALGAPAMNLRPGQAWLITAGGLAGLVAGFGVDLLAEFDDDKGAVVPPLLGSALGIAATFAAVQKSNRELNVPIQASLLEITDGSPRVGIPVPLPNLTRSFDRNGRSRYAPGMRLGLFSATF